MVQWPPNCLRPIHQIVQSWKPALHKKCTNFAYPTSCYWQWSTIQFKEVISFLQQHGIIHHITYPNHPQAHQAEPAMKPLDKGLRVKSPNHFVQFLSGILFNTTPCNRGTSRKFPIPPWTMSRFSTSTSTLAWCSSFC